MRDTDRARHGVDPPIAVHLHGGHWDEDWTLLPGQLNCWFDGFEVEARPGGNRLHLHKQDSSLTVRGRTETPLFCELDQSVRKDGRQKTFRVRFYDGIVRLEGLYRLQQFDRARVPQEGQALQFQAELAPAGEVRLLQRPCSDHPDFGLWRNPELDLLEYWWRDTLVTAIELEGNNGLRTSWRRQVVAYLEETASASHAAVTFLAQLRRWQPV